MKGLLGRAPAPARALRYNTVCIQELKGSQKGDVTGEKENGVRAKAEGLLRRHAGQRQPQGRLQSDPGAHFPHFLSASP